MDLKTFETTFGTPISTIKLKIKRGAIPGSYDPWDVELTLSDRVYKCDNCGLLLDRDLNASINILRLGMQSLETLGLILKAPTITLSV